MIPSNSVQTPLPLSALPHYQKPTYAAQLVIRNDNATKTVEFATYKPEQYGTKQQHLLEDHISPRLPKYQINKIQAMVTRLEALPWNFKFIAICSPPRYSVSADKVFFHIHGYKFMVEINL